MALVCYMYEIIQLTQNHSDIRLSMGKMLQFSCCFLMVLVYLGRKRIGRRQQGLESFRLVVKESKLCQRHQ